MSKTNKIPCPSIQSSKGKKIVEISLPKNEKPAISITYMQIDNNSFGLKGFAKKSNKSDRRLFSELEDFMKLARNYSDIQELIDRHCPKNGTKSKDSESISLMNNIKKEYNVDTSDMLHIHLQPCGKGEFVLHGFVLQNRFEVVWLDPFHEKHKS